MKKTITMLFALFVLCIIFCLTTSEVEAATIDSGTCGTNLTWVLDSEGILTISGTGAMTNWSTYSSVPWYSNNTSVETVVICSGVTSIGKYAFYFCTRLTTVTIPDSVTTIGSYAFKGCTGLTSVTIPDSVTTIGSSAFSGCSGLKSMTLPFVGKTRKTASSTYQYPFGYIFGSSSYTGGTEIVQFYYGASTSSSTSSSYYIPTNLKSVTITGGEILSGAFDNCAGLTSVTIPNSVTTIGSSAFENCTGLTSFDIPNGVITIETAAFRGCTNLTSVVIPNSVTTIGGSVFSGCIALSSVTFPDSVTQMDGEVFYDTAWYNEQPNGMIYIGKLAYAYKGTCPTTINIKDGTLGIAGSAFFIQTTLISVTIPDSVKSIGGEAFTGCTGLTSVTIPDGVTSIGARAFLDCTRLTEINFNAINMNDLSPDNLVFCNAGQKSTGIKVFIGAQVIKIPAYLFYPYDNLSYVPKITSIKFEENSLCTSIGKCAFYNCTRLTSVTIPNGMSAIGSSAFSNCTGLTSVIISDSVTTIGSGAFSYCTSLTSVTIPNGVIEIGMYAFENCTGLTSIIIMDGVTTIGYGAFSYCTSLTSVTIPDSVLTIHGGAFCGCTNLNSVVIPDSVTSIYEDAFSSCTGLTSITIPDSVTKIGTAAFSNCTGLTSVSIPGSVTEIDNDAFSGCTVLCEITFNGSAPSLEYDAFAGVTATAYYSSNDLTWTEDVLQNYSGTITWVSYDGVINVSGIEYKYFAEALAAYKDGQYIKLESNASVNAGLARNLHIDLNGYDLSGTIMTNGYKVYGMDSTTDGYSCDSIGYFNCVDENGKAIIPETHFKSDITGSTKRYMAIKDENGYSFHRFYLGITNQILRPTTTGVGYKAVFYGDEMVIAQLDADNALGFALQLEGNNFVSAYKDRNGVVSGKTITLRLNNYDVENHGETELSAKVVLKLSDGTVIESTECTMTMRSMLEALNDMTLTAEQQTAVKAMIEKFAIIKSWETENLYA